MGMLETILALLTKALEEREGREESVKAFQAAYWNSQNQQPAMRQDVYEILADLAYDLNFFEPDSQVRKEDPSYWGHERLEKEILEALHKLKSLGLQFPKI